MASKSEGSKFESYNIDTVFVWFKNSIQGTVEASKCDDNQ